jgi:hypothetical protein
VVVVVVVVQPISTAVVTSVLVGKA